MVISEYASMIEFEHHDPYVVTWSFFHGHFKDVLCNLLCSEFILAKLNCLLVRHSVPNAISCDDHEFVKWPYHMSNYVWLACNSKVLVSMITECSCNSESTSNPIIHYRSSCLLYAFNLFWISGLVVNRESLSLTILANHSPGITNVGNVHYVVVDLLSHNCHAGGGPCVICIHHS
jgi:hypothetical protein